MACCALKKQKKQILVFPVLLLLFTFIIGLTAILFLSVFGLLLRNVREKRNRTLKLFRDLLRGLINRILNEPFIFDSSFRCRISGKLMRFSNRMAGAVYKYFNLILLAFLVFAIYFLFQGFRVLLI